MVRTQALFTKLKVAWLKFAAPLPNMTRVQFTEIGGEYIFHLGLCSTVERDPHHADRRLVQLPTAGLYLDL